MWDQTGNQLLGIVRAPVSHCPLPTSAEEADEDLPAVVCEGRYDVWNLLEGRAEGSLEVFAVLQVGAGKRGRLVSQDIRIRVCQTRKQP